jgi:serine/threonine protein phosphatase 1
MVRTFVVGDIHGGLRALKQVLALVPYTSEDLFIFLGDYVDGWSDNAETISFLINFSEAQSCIFLRGNHDELLYAYLKRNEHNPTWLESGGNSSIKSYKKFTALNITEAEALDGVQNSLTEHITFLEQLENYHIDSDNRLYLHAGFTNQRGPQFEYYPNMVYWDRTLWEMVCSMDTTLHQSDSKYPKRLNLFKEIYIGHTPVTRIGSSIPTNFANVWNIDTGVAFKGSLSVIDVDSKEIWQSDPVWEFYPEEMGRN